MNNKLSSRIMNIIVVCGIVLSLLALAAVPLVLTAFLKSAFSILDQGLVIAITSCIYLCAVPYMIALFKLKKLSGIAVKNTPFSFDTVKALRVISICAFSEIVLFNGCSLYLVFAHDMYLYALTIFPMIIVTFVSLAIGFFSLTLAQLFEQAAIIKDENDQTI
ncbi:DUF2975 domain-containing protein [Paenibacillus marinisediminis]